MKLKIIFLIISLFLFTGCFDYQELNDRAIIVGLGIDYENEEFVVNFEVLNSQKAGSEQSGSNKSYLVEGKDKTFVMAYQNALNSINKDAYLAHLKAVVFSEEIAKDHLDNVVDYLIRDPNTRNVFYPVIAQNVLAKDILGATTEDTPVVSKAIEGLIEYNNFKESTTVKMNFENFLESLFSNHSDAYLNIVTLSDNKRIKTNGLAIFNKHNLAQMLTEDESATLQLLKNKSSNYYVKLPCPKDLNKHLTINLYDNTNTKLNVDEEKIIIDANYSANIMDDECEYNFKDVKVYEDLEKKFATKLQEDLPRTVKYFMHLHSDVLGIEKQYYNKTKKTLDNWYLLPVQSNIKVTINKNGVIFGVKNE